jgi:hypothetical protein
MQPSIPIPTDNIYKFVALFGLSLFISSGLASVAVHFYFNNILYKRTMESEILKTKADPSEEEKIRKGYLERFVSISMSDRKVFTWMLSGIAGIGVVLMAGGFSLWNTRIQPKQDELLNLQIEKIRREIQVLEKQLEKKDT